MLQYMYISANENIPPYTALNTCWTLDLYLYWMYWHSNAIQQVVYYPIKKYNYFNIDVLKFIEISIQMYIIITVLNYTIIWQNKAKTL